MCTLAMALSGIGTAISAYGSVMQGNAEASAHEAQARAAEQNAAAERERARQSNQRAALDSWRTAEQGRQFAGRQRAAQGATGVYMGAGNAKAMREDTAGLAAADTAATRYNGMLETWGYLNNASQYQNQAGAERSAASAAKSAGKWGAFTSILGGASSLLSQWGSYSQGAGQQAAAGNDSGWIVNSATSYGESYRRPLPHRSFYKGYWGLN